MLDSAIAQRTAATLSHWVVHEKKNSRAEKSRAEKKVVQKKSRAEKSRAVESLVPKKVVS